MRRRKLRFRASTRPRANDVTSRRRVVNARPYMCRSASRGLRRYRLSIRRYPRRRILANLARSFRHFGVSVRARRTRRNRALSDNRVMREGREDRRESGRFQSPSNWRFDPFDRQIAKVGITLYYRYRRPCLCVTPAICVGNARARERERRLELSRRHLRRIYGSH